MHICKAALEAKAPTPAISSDKVPTTTAMMLTGTVAVWAMDCVDLLGSAMTSEGAQGCMATDVRLVLGRLDGAK